MPEPWIIDTDPAIGLTFRDIDDALAIHAMVRGGLDVVALTTVFGNAPLERVHPIAQDLGRRYRLPVFRGAARPGDHHTAAVERLATHTGGVLGIGPCTNIAAALDRGACWSSLVLLGGTTVRAPNVRYLHMTELNFALDVQAAARALAACTTLFPMEVCRKVVFTAEDLAPLDPELRQRASSWLRIAPRLTGTPGFHPWDLLPALATLHPALVTMARHAVALETRWPRRGSITLRPPGSRAIACAMDISAASVIRRWRELV